MAPCGKCHASRTTVKRFLKLFPLPKFCRRAERPKKWLSTRSLQVKNHTSRRKTRMQTHAGLGPGLHGIHVTRSPLCWPSQCFNFFGARQSADDILREARYARSRTGAVLRLCTECQIRKVESQVETAFPESQPDAPCFPDISNSLLSFSINLLVRSALLVITKKLLGTSCCLLFGVLWFSVFRPWEGGEVVGRGRERFS